MLYRVGIVSEVNLGAATARVNFPDHDNVESNWLAVLSRKTLNDREYWMPDVGEQVVCLLDQNEEDGCILGAIYSQADAPPADSPDLHAVFYSDGSVWSYDRGAHAWTLDVLSGGSVLLRCGASSIEITDQMMTLVRNGLTIKMSAEGIQIGTGSSQPLSFWGASPSTQPGAITNPIGGTIVDVQARLAIAQILALLSETGLMS